MSPSGGVNKVARLWFVQFGVAHDAVLQVLRELKHMPRVHVGVLDDEMIAGGVVCGGSGRQGVRGQRAAGGAGAQGSGGAGLMLESLMMEW